MIDLDNDFGYHAPKGDQVKRYDRINRAAKELARAILEVCNIDQTITDRPDNPEATLAYRGVQQARMLANMAIAVNGVGANV